MDALSEAPFLDQHGDPLSDRWPDWLRWAAERYGFIGPRGGLVETLSVELRFTPKTIDRWLKRERTPETGVRRAIRRAWAAPVESKAMQGLAAALSALQAAQQHQGMKGGGATRKGGEKGAASAHTPPPAFSSPTVGQVDIEAMAAEAGLSPDDMRAILEGKET